MRELKCHVQEARLGQVWKYHISWYQDPARLDNVVVVRSRPREGGEKLEISSWTNEVDGEPGSRETPIVFYVKVSWLSQPVILCQVQLPRSLLPGCLWWELRLDCDYFTSTTMELIISLVRS